MASESENLVTDAVPDGPRKNINLQQNVSNLKSSEEDNEKVKLNTNTKSVLPLTKTNKKRANKDSKSTKSSTKSTSQPKAPNEGTKIYVVNSSGVHFGTVNNYNYACNDQRKYGSEEHIVLTDKINEVLCSKIVIQPEHIDLVSTHLGECWRDVGLDLGYSPGQLNNFYDDNIASGNKEVTYQMLLDWSRIKGDAAVLGNLATVLWHSGQRLIVKNLTCLI